MKTFRTEYYANLKMDSIASSDLSSISTETMTVTQAFIGFNPLSPQYGIIKGFFTYKGQEYLFTFQVHRPKQKHAVLSNKMINIQKCEEKELYGIIFEEIIETNMGNMAFWAHSPLDYLKDQDEDSYELRKLVNNIIAYSRKNDLCKQLRKSDKEALKSNPIYRSR